MHRHAFSLLALLIAFVLIGGLPSIAQGQQRKPAAAAKGPLPKGQVEIDGVFVGSSQVLTSTARPRIYAEAANISTTHDIPSSFGFGAGGSRRVWKNLGVGAAFTMHQSSSDVAITGSIPHPFVFSQPRSFDGSASGLHRQETSFAIQARGYFPLSRRVYLTVFGGPVLTLLDQSVVTAVDYSEAYPYDTATFRSNTVATAAQSKWGAGAGVDVAYFRSRRMGVGASIKFSGATFDVPGLNGGSVESQAGGLYFAVGGRFRF